MAGSFNPPHLGHLQVLRLARDEMQLDAIWLLPLAGHPFKSLVRQCTIEDKVMLCKDLCSGFDWARVFADHHQVGVGGHNFFSRFISYIKKIEAYQTNDTPVELFKICGSDSFRHLLRLAKVLRMTPPSLLTGVREALGGTNFIVSPRWGSDGQIPRQIDIGWGYPMVNAVSLVNTNSLKPYHQLSSRRIRTSLLRGERSVHGLEPSAETKILACLRIL